MHGFSPYQALIGRTPNLLQDFERESRVEEQEAEPGRSSTWKPNRRRATAVAAILEGTQKDRMQRALNSKSRQPGEALQLNLGDRVDFWRASAHKDQPGWFGPGKGSRRFRSVIWCRLRPLARPHVFLTSRTCAQSSESPRLCFWGTHPGNCEHHRGGGTPRLLRPGRLFSDGFARPSQGLYCSVPCTDPSTTGYCAKRPAHATASTRPFEACIYRLRGWTVALKQGLAQAYSACSPAALPTKACLCSGRGNSQTHLDTSTACIPCQPTWRS